MLRAVKSLQIKLPSLWPRYIVLCSIAGLAARWLHDAVLPGPLRDADTSRTKPQSSRLTGAGCRPPDVALECGAQERGAPMLAFSAHAPARLCRAVALRFSLAILRRAGLASIPRRHSLGLARAPEG